MKLGVEAELQHGVEKAALDRLQPVADVRQRACGDGRQRIGEVALAERVGEADRKDALELRPARHR